MHAITDKEKQEVAELEEMRCTEEQKKVLRGGYQFSIRASNKTLSNEKKQKAIKRNHQDKITLLGGVDLNMIEFVFLMLQRLDRKCKKHCVTPSVG